MRIFFSYGRDDTREFSVRLASWLRLHGHDPWLDTEHGIPPGSPFNDRIEDAIRESDFVLAILSRDHNRQETLCHDELLSALTHTKAILPVRISGVSLPTSISSLPWLDASDDPGSVFIGLPGILDTIARKAGSGMTAPVPDGSAGRTAPGTALGGPSVDASGYGCGEAGGKAPGPGTGTAPASGSWREKAPVTTILQELAEHRGTFNGREWLLDELETRTAGEDLRILLLTGEPGIGKSALCARLPAHLDVRAMYVFSPLDPDSCRPDSFISTLASQLARQFPGYREVLEKVPRPEKPVPPEVLFRMLITDPLEAVNERPAAGNPRVVIIDGLDKAAAGGGAAMADFLEESLRRFPPWFRVIATARPDHDILARFRGGGIVQLNIDPASVDNRADIADYIRSRMQSERIPVLERNCDRVGRIAAGNFLYITALLDLLAGGKPLYRMDPDSPVQLPPALCARYDRMFRERFPDITVYRQEIAPIVSCLAVARGTVPESLLLAAAGPDRPAAARNLRALSQFLAPDGNRPSFFHASLAEWLKDDMPDSAYAVEAEEGYRRLANAGLQEVTGTTRDIPEYLLSGLPRWLARAGMPDELAEVLRDPRFIEGLCNENPAEFLKLLSFIEENTPLRTKAVYEPVVNAPYRYDVPVLEIVANTLQATGDPDGAMSLFRELEWICREQDDRAGMAKSQGCQANILRVRGQLDAAMDLLKKVEKRFRNPGDVAGLSDCLASQGMICQAKDDLDTALRLFGEQEQVCRKYGYTPGVLNAMTSRAFILHRQGQLLEAREVLKEQERVRGGKRYQSEIIRSLSIRALIHMDFGEFRESMDLLNEMEKVCHELGDRKGLAHCYGNQGCVLNKMGDTQRALALFRRQEAVCRELNDREGTAAALGNQGSILLSDGNPDGAMACFLEQETICREPENLRGLAISLVNQARVFCRQDNLSRAFELAAAALSIAHEHGFATLEEQFRSYLQQIATARDEDNGTVSAGL